jgi:hypothetical protein
MTEQHPAEPGPGATTAPSAGYETRDANVRIILTVAGVLAVSTTVICLAVWWFYLYLDWREAAEKKSQLRLVVEAKEEPPPPPRLEAFEPTGSLLLLNVGGVERMLYVDGQVTVLRDQAMVKNLFELREGTKVRVAYESSDGRDRVVSILTPPPQEAGAPEGRLHAVVGTIARFEPRGVRDRRDWADARMHRPAEWVDRDKGVARIPIDLAMQIIADRKLGPPPKEGAAPAGPLPGRPSESNSGRGLGGEGQR